jgi:hypothetical protein
MTGAASLSTSSPRIEKRFVRAGGRLVHYRVAGEGPAVVMLHDSPRSSRLHVPAMRHLAQRFRVTALDTAGYGNSAPLDGNHVEIADFADALGEVLAALGLVGAPLYAAHTGAKIALHYAAETAAPCRLILDGLSIPAVAPDPDFIARYMRDFKIDAGGGYLASEWTRLRDMLRWFPWFDPRAETRMPVAAPDHAWIEAYALDFFSAGPHYADAYAAAMRYDPRPALRRLSVPSVVAARADDVLYESLDRVPRDRHSVTVERLGSDPAAWLEWLERQFAASAEPHPPANPAVLDDQGPCYVDLPWGQMLVTRQGPAGGRQLLILDAPTLLHARAWQSALASQRGTIVPELPGYGESDPIAGGSLGDYAEALACMLHALGETGGVDVLGFGFATPLAVELAVRHPALVQRLLLDGALAPTAPEAAELHARLCPAFTMTPSGSHLHEIWHMLRDGEAQWPWYEGSVAAQRRTAPVLGAEALHQVLLDLLKQPQSYGAVARAGLGTAIPYARLTIPVLLFEVERDPAYRRIGSIKPLIPNAQTLRRPADIPGAARLLAAALTVVLA